MKKILLLLLITLFSLSCFIACSQPQNGNDPNSTGKSDTTNDDSSDVDIHFVTKEEFDSALTFEGTPSFTAEYKLTMPNDNLHYIYKQDGNMLCLKLLDGSDSTSEIYELENDDWFVYQKEDEEMVRLPYCTNSSNDLKEEYLTEIIGLLRELGLAYEKSSYENEKYVANLSNGEIELQVTMQFKDKKLVHFLCNGNNVNSDTLTIEITFSNYGSTVVSVPLEYTYLYTVTEQEFKEAVSFSNKNYTLNAVISAVARDENGVATETTKYSTICKFDGNRWCAQSMNMILTYELVNGVWYLYQEDSNGMIKLEFPGDPTAELEWLNLNLKYEDWTFKGDRYIPNNDSINAKNFLQFKNGKLYRIHIAETDSQGFDISRDLYFSNYYDTQVYLPEDRGDEFGELFNLNNLTIEREAVAFDKYIRDQSASLYVLNLEIDGNKWLERTWQSSNVRYFDGEYAYKNGGVLDQKSQTSLILEFVKTVSLSEIYFDKINSEEYISGHIVINGVEFEKIRILVQDGKIEYIYAYIRNGGFVDEKGSEFSVIDCTCSFTNYGTTVVENPFN